MGEFTEAERAYVDGLVERIAKLEAELIHDQHERDSAYEAREKAEAELAAWIDGSNLEARIKAYNTLSEKLETAESERDAALDVCRAYKKAWDDTKDGSAIVLRLGDYRKAVAVLPDVAEKGR